MSLDQKEWRYYDEESAKWIGPLSINDLDAIRAAGRLEDSTQVVKEQALRGSPVRFQPILYHLLPRLAVTFTPSIDAFYDSRLEHNVTVLSGPNNGGKTLALKQLLSMAGPQATFIGCSRFSHVDVLNTRQLDDMDHKRQYDNYVQNVNSTNRNSDDTLSNLEVVITTLEDEARQNLFDTCKDLLGYSIVLKRHNDNNIFSPFFIDVDGQNLRYASSGTRLLILLLGTIFNRRYSTVIVDEPELGLSPAIQSAIAGFLYGGDNRTKLFPHIRHIMVATHSHLFLDRNVFGNNFMIERAGNAITISQVADVREFHRLQFSMLGNSFEAIFMPSAIMMVEGESDLIFLSRVVKIHIPDRTVAIVRAGGDGEVQNKLNVMKEAFGDLTISPYRDRIFVVLDDRHSANLTRIEKQGISTENITVWARNGIEYLYPSGLVAEVFRCNENDVTTINLETDPIEKNGIRVSKKDLARLIASKIQSHHELAPELLGVIEKVRKASG